MVLSTLANVLLNINFLYQNMATEIQKPDWSVAMVSDWTDHAAENHVLKAIENDSNRGLSSLRHSASFRVSKLFETF